MKEKNHKITFKSILQKKEKSKLKPKISMFNKEKTPIILLLF